MTAQWKLKELIERMASEDPEEIIRDELARTCGRIEARGFQSVKGKMEFVSPDDDSLLYVSITAICPCGAEKATTKSVISREFWSTGPHVLQEAFAELEREMTALLERVPG